MGSDFDALYKRPAQAVNGKHPLHTLQIPPMKRSIREQYREPVNEYREKKYLFPFSIHSPVLYILFSNDATRSKSLKGQSGDGDSREEFRPSEPDRLRGGRGEVNPPPKRLF